MKIPTKQFSEVLPLVECYIMYHDLEASTAKGAGFVQATVGSRRQARHIKEFLQKRVEHKAIQKDGMFEIELDDEGWYCLTINNK